MHSPGAYLRRFAVHGVLWRNYLDFALRNVPFYLRPILLGVWTIFFFFLAAPARRSILRNLSVIRPDSSALLNYLRAFRTLMNFAWSITDGANYRLNKADFDYEIVGEKALEDLSRARGAIVLTAHMGNYDLGAALFAQKFNREIQMVRAPEPDRQSERHLVESMQQTGEGAVKIAYSTNGFFSSFDLLGALRRGKIVSIQGDRVIAGMAAVEGEMFGRRVHLPSGPFTLAKIAEVPIFPLFIVRAAYHRYRIIVHQPLAAGAPAAWCKVLEETVGQYWDQWFAFGPIFASDGET